MISLETIRLKVIEKYIKYTAKARRKQIKIDDFTIISNNCWGGKIYQSYGLQYNTPTVGLFFMAEDYIKFVYNIKDYLQKELEFIDIKESKYYQYFIEQKKIRNYPIGKLGDVEIHFLHYKSPEEAKEKWERRTKRINWEHILFKFNDQNLCTQEHLELFSKLPQKNKICFVSKPNNIKGIIYIKMMKEYKEIQASYEPFGKSKYINMNEIINSL